MAATATSNTDYFASRPSPRSRPSLAPKSPRTPLLARSISGQFGSPGGSYLREQEEVLVWELHQRYISVGIAGESRPRGVLRFGYGATDGRRVGDWRGVDGSVGLGVDEGSEKWAREYEVFRADVTGLDLGLVAAVLERAVRTLHVDYLQLDAKPRKVVLAVPSLLPLPVLELSLKVLFGHDSQPPVVTLMPTPLLACVGAGLRNALVVEIGWEETVVTAIGEYKTVAERRSIRGGKMLVVKTSALLQASLNSTSTPLNPISFKFAEDVAQRTAHCPADPNAPSSSDSPFTIPLPSRTDPASRTVTLPFYSLAIPATNTFFPASTSHNDSNDLPIPTLLFRTLLALPSDLRAQCMARIVLTGSSSNIPGLRTRLLREVETMVRERGWDQVHSYGSAKSPLPIRLRERTGGAESTLPPYRPPAQPAEPVSRTLDPPPPQQADPTPGNADPTSNDPSSPRASIGPATSLALRIDRRLAVPSKHDIRGVVRGVETLGAWAGGSLFASLAKSNASIRGVAEITREEWEKKGIDVCDLRGL
ncbi:hypothetical protein B0A48_08453 [Cryoendolithus antarcticus]|uniref:Actin-like ATPase domain-containing protein n=1 Tax=Cryoendolithus antarcticus TaxID=1507870 RepID=A0A1V8T5G8_9PEZI|nr:hypothetical protein B0A48_08453 [Cryoendolithus antarcticus]